MSGFLYFIERQTTASLAALREWGLGYAFENQPSTAELDGPGGKGVLVADTKRLGEYTFGYLPTLQTWRPLPTASGLAIHVGYYTEAKPTPEDLIRKTILTGDAVDLCDGQKWIVPRLRFWGGETGWHVALPCDYDVDDDGNWIMDGACGEYEALDAIGQRLIEGMYHENFATLQTTEALDIVSTLLAVNYVVSKVELGKRVLSVLRRDGSLKRACRAAVDGKRAEEWAEKKSAEEATG